ncbi:glycosyltransferase [Amnibacterium sp.]|uniref:glycosyltransferase family 2 protein n=1 Tax=Amnibacterium sp. TaxID=1872496 RepID=UPI002633EEF3|nr:glycosyltransferase [Amnibacterium sp.]MCU1474832.1 glycosyltransferase [Amnibacterium sp.]
MTDVSVLIASRNPGSALAGLVHSLDGQSLTAGAFEVVIVDASDDGSADRLRQLADRRVNVTVLTAGADRSDADRLETALGRATGEYAIALGQDWRLAPLALELLLDRARSTGADLVVGRVADGAVSGSTAVPDDADRVDPTPVDLTGCLGLFQRSSPRLRHEPGLDLLHPASLVMASSVVSAVGRYACATRDGGEVGSPADVSIDAARFRWSDGLLRLTVGIRVPEPRPSGLRAWLVLTQGLTEVALPAEVGPDDGDGTGDVARCLLDPATAGGGRPLDDGPWDLRLRLALPGGEITRPLPAGPPCSAVVEGRPHVLGSDGGFAQLDAGATRTSVIGRVEPSETSIVESARGILVTLEHPDVHVHGDAVLDARLLLDKFRLPARLVCRDGRARLESYVSSLAGVRVISVVAGGGKPVPTGLQLRVDGAGAVALEAVPPKAPTPPPATGADVPLAQRLRRRVPGALDPALRLLVRVPVVRRTYRLLIGR